MIFLFVLCFLSFPTEINIQVEMERISANIEQLIFVKETERNIYSYKENLFDVDDKRETSLLFFFFSLYLTIHLFV